jgi:hypothetical protein
LRRGLGREVAREAEHRPFGRPVTRQLWDASEHCLGDGIDDATVPGFDEVRPRGSGDEERPEEVGVEHGAELVETEFIECAGVVDAALLITASMRPNASIAVSTIVAAERSSETEA